MGVMMGPRTSPARTAPKLFRSREEARGTPFSDCSANAIRTISSWSMGMILIRQRKPESSLQSIDKGFTQHEVEICFRSRPEGSHSKLHTVRDGLRVLRTILTIVKDFRPLLFFSILGAVFLVLSVAAGSLPILDYLRY